MRVRWCMEGRREGPCRWVGGDSSGQMDGVGNRAGHGGGTPSDTRSAWELYKNTTQLHSFVLVLAIRAACNRLSGGPPGFASGAVASHGMGALTGVRH